MTRIKFDDVKPLLENTLTDLLEYVNKVPYTRDQRIQERFENLEWILDNDTDSAMNLALRKRTNVCT